VLGSKYTWLVARSWNRLHYIPGIDDDQGGLSGLAFWKTYWDGWMYDTETARELPPDRGDLPAVCGIRAQWQLPGIFTRMGGDRCRHCCRKLGIAWGLGAPFNLQKGDPET